MRFVDLTFIEYLRFIYQEKAYIENEDKAMQLYILADKYLQEDLCEECVNWLNKTLKENNVFEILKFAHEQNISKITIACLEFFQGHLDINNVAELIRYFDCEEDSEF